MTKLTHLLHKIYSRKLFNLCKKVTASSKTCVKKTQIENFFFFSEAIHLKSLKTIANRHS